MKETLSNVIGKFKDRFVLSSLAVLLIAGFILGFNVKSCTGIQKEDYNKVVAENDTLTSQITQMKEEYDEYKEKMQPYEDVQLADEQNRVEAEKLKNEQDKQALAEKQAAEKRAAEEEKARKDAEEKAAAAAKAAEEAKGYETGITFDNLARTPDEYKGKKVKFSGKVIQVIEGTTETQLRLAINNNYDQVIFCRVPKALTSSTRILEDDRIHILGVSNGLISYKSTLGGTITIPDVSVNDWGPN